MAGWICQIHNAKSLISLIIRTSFVEPGVSVLNKAAKILIKFGTGECLSQSYGLKLSSLVHQAILSPVIG